MSLFVQSIKAKTQNKVEFNYSLNLKALRQNLNPTNNFEKQPNFTPVFSKKLKFRPFLKSDFRKMIIPMTLACFYKKAEIKIYHLLGQIHLKVKYS